VDDCGTEGLLDEQKSAVSIGERHRVSRPQERGRRASISISRRVSAGSIRPMGELE
jgi:hypothetical protein